MYCIPPRAQALLSDLYHRCTGYAPAAGELEVIAAGASGRTIVRPCADIAPLQGIIGIYHTAERADNAAFVPAARGLKAAGVPVPEILLSVQGEDGVGACLAEDLGSQDLLSLKDSPWEERRAAYTKALRSLALFHCCRPDWELQPEFDTALYRWEQAYFAEHFLTAYLGKDGQAFLESPAMQELAEYTAAQPRVPVHRDCQSQNIMLRGGHAWFVDFQGMRMGVAEYDLASLLLDPYMQLSPTEQADLLQIWQQITGRGIDYAVYSACALQRVMQALGAYANIGLNKNNPWYLERIPAGLNSLRCAMSLSPADSPAAHASSCLQAVI